MTVLNDDFLASIGIKETKAFDFTKEAIKQEGQDKILEDNTRFLPDSTVTSNKKDVQRALNKGKSDHIDKLSETIWKHETNSNFGEYNVYEAPLSDGGVEINVGPGLRLNDSSNVDLFKQVGLDPDKMMVNRGRVPAELNEKLNQVFKKRVKRAEQDAIRFIGGSKSWKSLTDYERSALTEMSYNLGATKLNGFKNTKAFLEELVKFRRGGKGYTTNANVELKSAIASEMADSKWYRQIGSRAQNIIDRFMGEDEGYIERFKSWMKS